MSKSLDNFTISLNTLVDSEPELAARAAGAAELLPQLLEDPDCLPWRCRQADTDHYAQHVVYVHPQGAYSLVSLVWLPSQETPIHDHRCWCVVGVLRGVEHETSYHLHQKPGEARYLIPKSTHMNHPGDVSFMVPPNENIHYVANGGQDVAISLHVYGADIAALGSSINEVFTDPVRAAAIGEDRMQPGRQDTAAR